MITVLSGDNSFEVEQERKRLVAGFSGTAETIDGSSLDLRQLPELMMGSTLFATQRLVIIKNLSENSALWTALGDWLARTSPDIDLVLVEAKLDKRTKTYKALQKAGTIKEFTQWTERDAGVAEKWTVKAAQQEGVALDAKNAAVIVRRSMVASDKPGGAIIDQRRITQAVKKLTLLDEVTPAAIDDVIEASPVENVFNLLDAALRGDGHTVKSMLMNLELSEDPYRLFGLLGGQVFQLAALSVTDKPSAEVAKDIGVHPYALSKLAPRAKSLGRNGVKKVVDTFAQADYDMKSSGHEPWLLIERALIKTANI